jgi:hypothetical protein
MILPFDAVEPDLLTVSLTKQLTNKDGRRLSVLQYVLSRLRNSLETRINPLKPSGYYTYHPL